MEINKNIYYSVILKHVFAGYICYMNDTSNDGAVVW